MASQMKAVGVTSKFAYAFEKNGGTVEMMGWLADDPELMKEVVQVADRRLLVASHGIHIRWQDTPTYVPRGWFTIGDHNGTRIVELEGDFSPLAVENKVRILPDLDLSSFVLRKSATRSSVYGEINRQGLRQLLTIDHLVGALIDGKSGRHNGLLDMTGMVNEFYVPQEFRNGTYYFPIEAIFLQEKKGWKLRAPGEMTPNDSFRPGTRFIFDARG